MGAAPPSRPRPLGPTASREEAADGLTIRRGTLRAAACAMLVLMLWAAATAWYLVNHDTLAGHLLKKQAEMQYAYEGRIAAMRDRLEQAASQRLVVQESLETRVADLAARNSLLETRQALVSSLLDQAGSAAGLPPRAAAAAEPAPLVSASPPLAKPSPVPDGLDLRLRDTSAAPEPLSAGATEKLPSVSSSRLQDRLGRLQNSIARIETAQLRAVRNLVHRSEQQITQLRGVVGNTGIDPDRLDPALANAALGGPLVPVAAGGLGFDAVLEQARRSLALLEGFRRASAALPLGRPTAGDSELTSGYGVRLDPFTRGPALHTGLDFRAEYGAAVRATGAGQVVSAEYAGGYGNMVEIEHANGVTTRYAHLSSLAVAPGQRVAAGTLIGRIGSSGRSTGPHLHYETRIDGQPVDPQRFLKAGAGLAEIASR